jgi:tyrosine-protein phosphatase SIW14
MSRVLRVGAGTVVVVLLIVGPVVYALRQQAHMRNFRVVRERVLYRSGQMTPAGLDRAFHDYGIKTVISLRDGTTQSDLDEEAFCDNRGVLFVRIPPSRWGDVGGSVPVEAGVKRFKEILQDRRYWPVLVHCFAGIHRTGAYTAIYRMEFDHWSNARAIAEVKASGYSNLDEELDILGFLEQYRPDWKAPESQTSPKAAEEAPQPHTRRGSRGPALASAKKGTRTFFKQKRAASPPSLKKHPGRKKRSRPARHDATTPGAAAGWRRPAAA